MSSPYDVAAAQPRTPTARSGKTALEVLVIVILVALAIAGLVALCMFVFLVYAISQFGSNK